MHWTTPDLCDQHDHVTIAEPMFRDYGGRTRFGGRIATVRCAEDNSRVRELLASEGRGRVLVVDGGGSLRRSLLGDQLATMGLHNGWNGVLVNGAVRDVEVLSTLALGVKALAAIPLKTDKRGLGEVEVEVEFASVRFLPGHWIYADANGIVVSATALVHDEGQHHKGKQNASSRDA